jgi:hypothetical protein
MIILEKRDIPDDLLQYFDEVAVGRSSIWTLNTGASSSSHYASFNHTLTELPIKACCPELVCSVCRTPAKVGCKCKASMIKGVVYDIFSGIATTARSAKKLNRDYIGSDISKEYHNVAQKVMEKEDAQNIPGKSENETS